MVLSIWNSNKFYRQQRVDSPSERSTRPLEFMNLPKLIAVKAARDSSVIGAESWVNKVLAKQGGTAKLSVSSLQFVGMERFFLFIF
ncbi:hypothetical protein IGI44_001037 [Enterococcus sp. DIV0756]